MNTYKVIAENTRRTIEYFETRYFNTIKELEEYFEGFDVFGCEICLNIYRDDAKLMGYLQDTPSGFVAVCKNDNGEEILLREEE